MPLPLALSTSWNSRRHTDGQAMLRELAEAGFPRVELGHAIWISLMAGILDSPLLGDPIEIVSLHNFCPLPVAAVVPTPNLYNLASPDDRERMLGIRNTLRTIDHARRLGARAVVLHMGSAGMRNYTAQMIQLGEAGQLHSRRHEKLLARYHRDRERQSRKYFPKMLDSLKRLEEYAGQAGVRLGIEARSGLEELPTEPEILALLDATSPDVVGYWHDVGHAQLKENLGVINHLRWLQHLAGRLIGIHIQDIRPVAHDHLAPGQGTFPFATLQPFVRPDTILVLELHHRVAPEEIHHAADLLEALWGPALTSLPQPPG